MNSTPPPARSRLGGVASSGLLGRDGPALAALALAAAAASAIGLGSGNHLLLPLLAVPLPYWVFLNRVQEGRRGSALGLMAAWAAFQSLSIILLTQRMPEQAAAAIVNGPHYRDLMFHWIRTGQGAEGDWRQFLPQHGLHYATFMALSALTAGAGGLVLGTLLLDYMSFYVGSLFLADAGGAHTLRLSLMGWSIWSVLRVLGYIAGAVAMADLTLSLWARRRGHDRPWPGRSSFALSLSLALVILDALLKALLASSWRVALVKVLGAGSS